MQRDKACLDPHAGQTSAGSAMPRCARFLAASAASGATGGQDVFAQRLSDLVLTLGCQPIHHQFDDAQV